MTSDTQNTGDMIVCFCHGVIDGEIREAIRQGANTLALIKEKTRASTGCGGCTCEVERILSEMLTKSAK
jgi:NAD(P)H-nitrite reductase large subunit